jgi:hypothetical protein
VSALQSSGCSLENNPVNRSAGLDLCTKKGEREPSRAAIRYKTRSAGKSLILLDFLSRPFQASARQALDFSGRARPPGADFNKVIHMIRRPGTNEFQINDLAALCKAQLKLEPRLC